MLPGTTSVFPAAVALTAPQRPVIPVGGTNAGEFWAQVGWANARVPSGDDWPLRLYPKGSDPRGYC